MIRKGIIHALADTPGRRAKWMMMSSRTAAASAVTGTPVLSEGSLLPTRLSGSSHASHYKPNTDVHGQKGFADDGLSQLWKNLHFSHPFFLHYTLQLNQTRRAKNRNLISSMEGFFPFQSFQADKSNFLQSKTTVTLLWNSGSWDLF